MREVELHAIEQAYRAALARLTIIGGFLSLTEWAGVDPARAPATAARWSAYSLRVLAAVRRKSMRLGIAYYRLARALDTGHTVNTPSVTAESITLAALRKEFLDLVLEAATLESEATASGQGNEDESWFESEVRHLVTPATPPGQLVIDDRLQDLLDAMDASQAEDALVIGIDEDFEWPKAVLQGDALAARYGDKLDQIAIDHHKLQLQKLRDDLTPEQVTALLAEIHARSGVKAAGLIDMAGGEVADDLLHRAGKEDSRAPRWARVTSDQPCPFCALMAARGFVFITESTAGFKPHDHCHCTKAMRWAADATLPPLTQRFEQLYADKIAGKFSGAKASLKEWRQVIKAEQAATAK